MSESWYLVEAGSSQGPFDAAAMAAKVADGTLRADSQICRVGAQAWSRADADEALRALFAAGAQLVQPAQAWSIGLGFRMLKAWKGPSWGAMVLVGLVWFALLLPSYAMGVVLEVAKESADGTPPAGLLALTGLVSLFTNLFVQVPCAAAIAVMGSAALVGTLRVPDLFMAYRRYFGVLGASIVYGAGMALGYIVIMLVALLLPMLMIAGKNNTALMIGGLLAILALLIVCVVWFVRRAVRYAFGVAIVCDPANRSVKVFDAFRRSADALKGKEGSVLGFLFLVGLLAALTTLLLGVGLLLIGWPMILCAYGAVYRVLVCRQPPPPSAASAGA